MATESRPVKEYAPGEWFSDAYELSKNSEEKRDISEKARQLGRATRIETDLKTKTDQLDSNTRLSDRIDIIRRWRELLEKTKANLDKEIQALSETKEEMEHQLEDKNINEDIVNECLNNRDCRRGIENISDDGQKELRNEQNLIAECKKLLQSKIDDAFEQLCRMQEAREDFFGDLQDKTTALEIDITQYNMNEKSPHISYKPNPTRKPKMSTDPQEWEDFSRYSINRAKTEMVKGQRTREDLHYTAHKVDDMLDHQSQRTEYALRKRIHELEQAVNELEYQKKLTEKEREELLDDIKALEEAARAKIPSAKLTQTRLENRLERPRMEQCRDAAQEGLVDEVGQLADSKETLEERLANARNALDGVDKKLAEINDNLNGKKHALLLDKMSLDYRLRLKTVPMTRTPCNMIPYGIMREKSVVVR